MPDSNPVAGASRHPATRCRKCFINFGRLPPELRHMVWQNALEENAPGRFRIIPTAGLVSPVLLVCRESRHWALKHYSLRIPVHEVSRWAPVTSVELHGSGPHPIKNLAISEHGAERGCLYLNPGQDPIVLGVRYTYFKEPVQRKGGKPYYGCTTKKIEPDSFNLSPLRIVRWDVDRLRELFMNKKEPIGRRELRIREKAVANGCDHPTETVKR
ncbi:hypothetical protein PG994_013283 [Apiospora phragmitis]|uniref:2EXR domain-containing protein n=1 Tax=Apiospora phragmitis TaxID=2905665 RepID=A0ABR1T9Y0_9PEZI